MILVGSNGIIFMTHLAVSVISCCYIDNYHLVALYKYYLIFAALFLHHQNMPQQFRFASTVDHNGENVSNWLQMVLRSCSMH